MFVSYIETGLRGLDSARAVRVKIRTSRRSERGLARSMNAEDTRTCLVCGAQFPATKEFCPVCMLHEALGEQVEPTASPLEEGDPELRPLAPSPRFEHYELVVDKDHKPVELETACDPRPDRITN